MTMPNGVGVASPVTLGGKKRVINKEVQSIALAWNKAMADAGFGYQPPLPPKELGQLKLIGQMVAGCNGIPLEFITHVVAHWADYCLHAETTLGSLAYKPGVVPNIAFVLKTRTAIPTYLSGAEGTPEKKLAFVWTHGKQGGS